MCIRYMHGLGQFLAIHYRLKHSTVIATVLVLNPNQCRNWLGFRTKQVFKALTLSA